MKYTSILMALLIATGAFAQLTPKSSEGPDVTITSAADLVLTSAHYGKTVSVIGAVTNAITLPANGITIGTKIGVALGAGTTDATVVTISAATADTLVGPGDQDLDSVTWGSGHRIGAIALFISDGSFWHVQNLGGTTMTYTD